MAKRGPKPRPRPPQKDKENFVPLVTTTGGKTPRETAKPPITLPQNAIPTGHQKRGRSPSPPPAEALRETAKPSEASLIAAMSFDYTRPSNTLYADGGVVPYRLQNNSVGVYFMKDKTSLQWLVHQPTEGTAGEEEEGQEDERLTREGEPHRAPPQQQADPTYTLTEHHILLYTNSKGYSFMLQPHSYEGRGTSVVGAETGGAATASATGGGGSGGATRTAAPHTHPKRPKRYLLIPSCMTGKFHALLEAKRLFAHHPEIRPPPRGSTATREEGAAESEATAAAAPAPPCPWQVRLHADGWLHYQPQAEGTKVTSFSFGDCVEYVETETAAAAPCPPQVTVNEENRKRARKRRSQKGPPPEVAVAVDHQLQPQPKTEPKSEEKEKVLWCIPHVVQIKSAFPQCGRKRALPKDARNGDDLTKKREEAEEANRKKKELWNVTLANRVQPYPQNLFYAEKTDT